jgi:hypothetical protein
MRNDYNFNCNECIAIHETYGCPIHKTVTCLSKSPLYSFQCINKKRKSFYLCSVS